MQKMTRPAAARLLFQVLTFSLPALALLALLAPLSTSFAAASANPYAGKIQDKSGQVIGEISKTGEITDLLTNLPIGTVDPKGMVSAPDGAALGKAPSGDRLAAYDFAKNAAVPPKNAQNGGDFSGQVKDASGTVVGNIETNGAIEDAQTGGVIGTVTPEGQVRGATGALLGDVPVGDQWAAYKMAKEMLPASPPLSGQGAFTGDVVLPSGTVIGGIDAAGNITDAASGEAIGTVSPQGQVSDANSAPLGIVAIGDKLAAYQLARKAFN